MVGTRIYAASAFPHGPTFLGDKSKDKLKMQRRQWEYLTAVVSMISWEKRMGQLDDLGRQGWELVQIVDGIAWFKRPVVEG